MPWNHCIVGVVHKESQACVACSSTYGAELRGSQAEPGIEVSDLIPESEFSKAIEAITNIRADLGAPQPVLSGRITLVINSE